MSAAGHSHRNVRFSGTEYGLRSRIGNELDNQRRYTSNPKRLSFNINTPEIDNDGENLEALLDRIWKVYRVSPLNNFSYTTGRLKQYSRRLREGLSMLQTTSMKETHYDVTFTAEGGLTQTPHDREAIKIFVKLYRNGNASNEDDEEPSSFYLGYLISRGNMKPMVDMSKVYLPILLCQGPVTTIRNINYLLEKFFDCNISPLKLSQDDLTWICTLFAEKSQNVLMKFEFPQPSIKNSINFKIHHANLSSLWNKIHDPSLDYVPYSEVKLLWSALIQQLFKVFQIDIGY
ncbi:hypothetical protein L9F63_010305 [Diploptera punctata]|uniref:Centromere protein L n=1 Tax=Diploptera punctata TaxID=6984 RepID=A0AAD8AIE5_DIPPU|nr:hypothetical protein L9F63_010305 [Diploptera punctata]